MLCLQDGVYRRQYRQSGECRENQTADDRAAKRRGLRSAFAQADRHRHHAEDHRGRGHQDRAQTADAPSRAASTTGAFLAPRVRRT